MVESSLLSVHVNLCLPWNNKLASRLLFCTYTATFAEKKRWIISLGDQHDITRMHHTQWPWIVWTTFVQMSNLKVKDARKQIASPGPWNGLLRVMFFMNLT